MVYYFDMGSSLLVGRCMHFKLLQKTTSTHIKWVKVMARKNYETTEKIEPCRRLRKSSYGPKLFFVEMSTYRPAIMDTFVLRLFTNIVDIIITNHVVTNLS